MSSEHVCLLYESRVEHLARLTSFHLEALAAGKRCVHVASDEPTAAFYEALSRAGVDPNRESERGALLLLSPEEVYLGTGNFDPAAAVAFWRETEDHALEDGFEGLCVSSDMSWALEQDEAVHRLPEYETEITDAVRAGRMQAMCCYDRRRFPPENLAQVFPTHPTVLFGEEVLHTDGGAAPSRNDGPVEDWLAPLLRQLRRSEDAVRETLTLKEKLLEVTPAGIYTCDRAGRITSFNPAAARLWGRAPALGELDERFCGSYRLYRPDGTPLPHDETPMAVALREGRGCEDAEVVIERPDGSLIHVLVNIAPLRDDRGRLTGAINCFIDITRRKRAEGLLHQRERGYHQLLDALPAGAYTCDVDGRITYFNRRAAKLWGREPALNDPEERFCGSFGIFSAEGSPIDARECSMAMALETEEDQVGGEVVIERPDGSRIVVLSNSHPIHDDQGVLTGAVTVLLDITERRHAKEAQARLAAIVESAEDAIIGMDLHGVVTSWNRAAEELYGYTAEEAIGGSVTLLLPPDRVDEEPEILERIARGEAVPPYETVRRRRDGTLVDVSLSVSPVIDERGRIVGASKIARDIGERKRTAEALARVQADSDRQKRLYEAVMGSTPDLAYVFDLDYRFTYANEALLRMWGRTWEDSIGKTLLEIGYEPWHAEMHEREIDHVVATKEPIRGEVPFTGTQGRRIYDYIFVPVLNDEGEVEAVAGTTRDVTERKLAEEALRESEERFRALTVASSDLVFSLSPDWGEIRRLGGGSVGSEADEVPGTWLEEFVHPDDQARARQAIDDAVRTRNLFELEHRVLREDGSVGWTLSRAVPIVGDDGEVVEWFGTAKDVTARKRSEEARARLQRKLRRNLQETETILNTAPISIAVAHDAEARVITGNPTFHRLLDVEPGGNASKTGPNAADLPFRVLDETGREIPPDELPMQRAAREGIELRNVPLVNQFRDGREAHVVLSASPLFDEEGRSRGAVAAFMDVTEQRRATAQLREADRRKDEFLAMLSHELRNPLATIRSAIEILRLDQEGASTARRGALGALERQVGTLTRLVDDLLDVSRVTTGRIQVRQDEIELNALVRSAVESARSLFQERRQELSVPLACDEGLWIRGDDTRLEQIVVNLLSNAAKYTPEEGRIWVTLEREGDEAVFRVRDTGVGIAPDLQPHVFDLFAQGKQPLDRAQSGLGIGLALTRSLVEMHGGTIAVESAGPDLGSEFVVRLPTAPRPSRQPEPEGGDGDDPHRSNSLRVLFVDDLSDARELASMLLEAYGFEVRTAADGPGALEAARGFKPGAVLLDIGLPGMDGYEVARRIREDPSLGSPVLVALTGYGQESDRQRSREAGFAHHLVKPVDFAQTVRPLLESIQEGRS